MYFSTIRFETPPSLNTLFQFHVIFICSYSGYMQLQNQIADWLLLMVLYYIILINSCYLKYITLLIDVSDYYLLLYKLTTPIMKYIILRQD